MISSIMARKTVRGRARRLLRRRLGRVRRFGLGALAGAACWLAVGCTPPQDFDQGPDGPVRVATFNTRCIVPEMDDLSVWTQIVNAMEKGATFCNGTLAELAGDILSVGGLTEMPCCVPVPL